MTGESVKNRAKAYMYFFPECNGKCRKGWHLHHVDVSLKAENPERYNEWRIEDLVPMLKEEHIRLHSIGRHHSEESKQKISEGRTGIIFSEEHKQNLKKSMKNYFENGGHSWNNGLKNCYSEEALKRMSDSHKGLTHTVSESLKKKFSDERRGNGNPFYGHTHSEKVRKAISEASKGKHYVLGYHWWNNGKEQVTSKECPGDGWVRGRLKQREEKYAKNI